MKVACWKVGEQQVAEEGTVVKLCMAGDKSDSRGALCLFQPTKKTFTILLTVFTDIRSPPNCQYLNQIEHVPANFK